MWSARTNWAGRVWRTARCLMQPSKRGSISCSPVIRMPRISRISRAVNWLSSFCPESLANAAANCRPNRHGRRIRATRADRARRCCAVVDAVRPERSPAKRGIAGDFKAGPSPQRPATPRDRAPSEPHPCSSHKMLRTGLARQSSSAKLSSTRLTGLKTSLCYIIDASGEAETQALVQAERDFSGRAQ